MRILACFSVMKVQNLVGLVWIIGLMIPGLADEIRATMPISAVVQEVNQNYKFERLDEVEKECGFVITQSIKLKTDSISSYTLKNELQFRNGDWKQDKGAAPLMPFDARNISSVSPNNSDFSSPLNLASFEIWSVGDLGHSGKTMNVYGLLELAVLSTGTLSDIPFGGASTFWLSPGRSHLVIQLEGIYTENEQNDGERVLCMLGNGLLPTRAAGSSVPWPGLHTSSSNYYEPTLSRDDKIMFLLRYPSNFTLTTREVRGELKSLNGAEEPLYFDKVSISSQLGAYANYQFGSESYVSKACKPYPCQDNSHEEHIAVYRGDHFCEFIQRFSWGDSFFIVPNWNCKGNVEFCSKLGPFTTGEHIRKMNGSFNSIKLIMQDVRCETGSEGNVSTARISAVLRTVLPFEDLLSAAQRSGLNGMALPAEGIWKSSAGQLCMVGCIGNLKTSAVECNSRISIYMPLSFSINQRRIVIGSVFSLDNATNPYYPLSFERVVHNSDLTHGIRLFYKYTKISLAGAFLERNQPFGFGNLIKKSFLKYPRKELVDERVSLSLLMEDLTLNIPALPDPIPNARFKRTMVRFQILSLDSFLENYRAINASVAGLTEQRNKTIHATEVTEQQLLINVSAELTLVGTLHTNTSTLFLEGLYDPIVGRMYLIGCRDVRASHFAFSEDQELEDGFDCLIEVEVQYPPTTSRWLANPSAKISIASQRNEDDLLYFQPVKLQTFPILYQRQLEDIVTHKGIEGILSILALSIMIACILSQLFYIKANLETVPFISIVMLGVQAVGYSIPLITGAEALFARVSSDSYESYNLKRYQILDYLIKVLVLAAFFLTLRLCQKVLKSRIRLLMRAPLEPRRVPNDKRVLQICLCVHTVGFLVILIVHSASASKRPFQSDSYLDSTGKFRRKHEWETELKEYVGLIQDFFLLPQIVGNILWQINGKPLRKFYYIGVTIVRLFPHIYDYITAPIANPYFSEQYEFVNPTMDFYSKFSDVSIPVVAAILAVVIFIQQRWSYVEIQEAFKLGKKSLLPLGSRVYERLPSRSFEAELVSGVNEAVAEGAQQKRSNI
ncbi:uncharacterized protein LOC116255845 isoform X2 [Nymphaea colorata]|uniref:uncharacterized protein LOC116255845 isoform X2 n=1 Tax=Nymphaea colorata TaxID=210225 RepID=UPI00129D7DFF|nr:uncharacterized protein LOC116255845 isoform X2 [Nymphaea colorata]